MIAPYVPPRTWFAPANVRLDTARDVRRPQVGGAGPALPGWPRPPGGTDRSPLRCRRPFHQLAGSHFVTPCRIPSHPAVAPGAEQGERPPAALPRVSRRRRRRHLRLCASFRFKIFRLSSALQCDAIACQTMLGSWDAGHAAQCAERSAAHAASPSPPPSVSFRGESSCPAIRGRRRMRKGSTAL
jgi:hypothetical protein